MTCSICLDFSRGWRMFWKKCILHNKRKERKKKINDRMFYIAYMVVNYLSHLFQIKRNAFFSLWGVYIRHFYSDGVLILIIYGINYFMKIQLLTTCKCTVQSSTILIYFYALAFFTACSYVCDRERSESKGSIDYQLMVYGTCLFMASPKWPSPISSQPWWSCLL